MNQALLSRQSMVWWLLLPQHEFMLAATEMREPRRLINYAGHLFRLTKARARDGDCPYCVGLRGQGAAAEVERYLKMPHLGSGRAQVTADSGHAGGQ